MTLDVRDEKGRAAPYAALAAAALVVAALGWLAWHRPAPPAAETAQASQPGVVVLTEAAIREAGLRVEPAAAEQVQDAIEAPGLLALDERRTARIGSQVEGKVLEVFVEIGDRVAAGRELAHMTARSSTTRGPPTARRCRSAGARKPSCSSPSRTTSGSSGCSADKAVSQQEVQRAGR